MPATGVLDSMGREECVGLVKSYGGKDTGGVSGKTTYLIAGNDAGTEQLRSLTRAHSRTRTRMRTCAFARTERAW